MPGMDNAHALVIGIASYRHVASLPPSVLKDAQDIVDLLLDPRHCGYWRENVHVLLDGQATREAVLQALEDLARRTLEDATLVMYLSAHGARVESGPHQGEYLLPVDAVYPTDPLFPETAISGAQLTEALRAIPARKVVVMFDCCYAGGIGRPKDSAAPGMKAGLSESYYEALQSGRGRVILASSRDSEYSWVLPDATNSLFTHHLLAGLRGGVASTDGLVRIFDLFEYLQPRVTGDRPNQHPIFKAELEENFAVALYRGGEKGEMPVEEDGFRYDAYISYVDREPDTIWVWETLVPRLESAGLKIAVSGDAEDPGVARVVSIERGIRQARRTVVVLSDVYLADHMAEFENVVAQMMGIQEGTYRLLPVTITPIDDGRLPIRLSMLARLDLAHPRRADREWNRLIEALRSPLPGA